MMNSQKGQIPRFSTILETFSTKENLSVTTKSSRKDNQTMIVEIRL